MTRVLIATVATCLLAAAPAHASTTTVRLRAKLARLARSRDHYKRLGPPPPCDDDGFDS